MSGNLWLKLSVRRRQDLHRPRLHQGLCRRHDLRRLGRRPGGALHSSDRLLRALRAVEHGPGANANKNVVKVAAREPGRLKKFSGGKAAWPRQWDFTSDTFGLGDVVDGLPRHHLRPELPVHQHQRLRRRRRQAVLRAAARPTCRRARALSFLFAFINDKDTHFGSPAQNISGDEFYWARTSTTRRCASSRRKAATRTTRGASATW